MRKTVRKQHFGSLARLARLQKLRENCRTRAGVHFGFDAEMFQRLRGQSEEHDAGPHRDERGH